MPLTNKDPQSDPFVLNWLANVKREVRRSPNSSSIFLQYKYDVRIEKIWDALVAREKVSKWLGISTGNISSDAEVTFTIGGEIKIEVINFEPPNRLLFNWMEYGRQADKVEIRLKADNLSTWLELEQFSQDAEDWQLVAGVRWETALIRLGMLLDVEDPTRISGDVFAKIFVPLWKEAGNRA